MKKLYWRPQRLSLRVLVLLALISIGGMLAVETYRVRERQPFYREKIVAAQLTARAFNEIKQQRLKRNIPIDEESDPVQSGLIGRLISSVTTNSGHLPSKQVSTNPNFSAVVVDLLGRAGVRAGDTIAVGVSGSFPAMNIAVYAAIETMKLKPIVISSVGSSQWGANHPKFMWPDMENHLFKKGIFKTRSIAMTLGGIDDQALGLSPRGLHHLHEAISRNQGTLLEVLDYRDNLEKRMALYQERAMGTDIRAYINVGGGTISVGTAVGKRNFPQGLTLRLPIGVREVDSVMTRFSSQEIPVIHLSGLRRLAARYGLPTVLVKPPVIGQGTVYIRETYNRWLPTAVLCLLVALLIAFLRLDLGFRLFSRRSVEIGSPPPEPMI